MHLVKSSIMIRKKCVPECVGTSCGHKYNSVTNQMEHELIWNLKEMEHDNYYHKPGLESSWTLHEQVVEVGWWKAHVKNPIGWRFRLEQ